MDVGQQIALHVIANIRRMDETALRIEQSLVEGMSVKELAPLLTIAATIRSKVIEHGAKAVGDVLGRARKSTRKAVSVE